MPDSTLEDFYGAMYAPKGHGKCLSEDAMRETSGNASLKQAAKMPENHAEFPPRFLLLSDRDACQQLIDLVHFLNAKWWVDLKTGEPINRNVGEMLMLVVSELAEAGEGTPKYNLLLMEVVKSISRAMEGHRKDLMDDKLPHRRMIEVEIADAIIRLLDMAGGLKLDVAGALVEKLVFNAKREDHTREHRLSEHGKKY